MNLLVFFGWSVKHISYTRVRATCNFVKKLCEIRQDVYPVFYFRNKKFYKYVEDILNSIPESKFIIRDISNKNWEIIKEDSIKIANDYKIDSILLSSMPIIKQYRLGSEKFFKENVIDKIYEDSQYGIKFNILFNFFVNYMTFIFMLNNNRKIKLFQYLDDPWEMDFKKLVSNDVKCIYEYQLEDRKIDIEIPFIGYTFFYKDFIENKIVKKDIDLVTGFMVPYENIDLLTKKLNKNNKNENQIESRVLYAIRLNRILENFKKSKCNFKIFYRIKGRDDENTISDIKFNELINKSKFSFIFPSPKTNEFPVTRLYYCFARKCIPFIDNQMNLNNGLFIKYPELKEFFEKNNLIQSFENIPNILEDFIKKYEDIIEQMQNLNFFKLLSEEKFFNESFSNIF